MSFGIVDAPRTGAKLSGLRISRAIAALVVFVVAACSKDESPPQEQVIDSIFVPLAYTTIDIPRGERKATGGAMMTLNGRLLLLTGDGRFYYIEEDRAKPADLTPPENGFSAYVQASQKPPFDKVDHVFKWFRYFDLIADGNTLFVSYLRFQPQRNCYETVVSYMTLPETQWTDLYATKPCLPLKTVWRSIEGHMAGGRIAIDGNRILLGSGDYAFDGMYGPRTLGPDLPPVAQDDTNDYGKVIEIDRATGAARHISIGHRNIQGLVVQDGRIWELEHGPRGGDELNAVEEGKNFGWPLVSYGTKYSGLPLDGIQTLGRHDGFDEPAFAWLPSIAPAAMIVIKDFAPEWNGDLLISTLAGGLLARVRTDDDRVIFAERITTNARVRHLHEHDGVIALWLDEASQIMLLRPAADNLGGRFVEKYITTEIEPDLQPKVRAAIDECSTCHSFAPNQNANAPSLAKIFGRKVGESDFQGYSDDLRNAQAVWNRKHLDKFLADSQALYPGSTMPGVKLDKETRAKVIDILIALATKQQ